MKWLEIIELRTASTNLGSVERFLQEWSAKIPIKKKQYQIKIYKHALVETDMAVHLYFDNKSEKRNFSSLGAQLASQLKEFGLVNHGVWCEKTTVDWI